MRWAGHVARMIRGMHIGHMWEMQKETTTKKDSRWVDNIKIDREEIGLGSIDWMKPLVSL
jgi:hypothetical protein